ncbi:phospholipase D/nuclease [Linderina pennispora]|uniref:Mitochondrial cardiolipin hydrolase n=1 Tax=Linderina pennispora TaxID=61395 RepID=A0A1Y1W0F0_9FUNG|nr:phospholipase D/nuclease [Linderina pennispora]ORX66973.1 phospholipase D/nuclease [Linderina pennispora]
MSLADILSACFGSGSSNAPGSRQAPYLSADEAANMPLEAFLERSLESSPSVMQQQNEFAEIFRRHLQNGANLSHIANVVRNQTTRLASSGTDRATADWAGQLFAMSIDGQSGGNRQNGGYKPPQMQPGSYAAAVGSDQNGWEMQQSNHGRQNNQKRDDTYIRSYFFPSEQSFEQLMNFLDSAKSTLDICVFNITDNDVANAIIRAKKRGVEVRIITDDGQLESKGSDVIRMQQDHGIPFKHDNDENKFMHSKFAVIDRRAVWMGSYNWTVGARRSNNESVIVTNDKSTADAFSREFEKLWRQF